MERYNQVCQWRTCIVVGKSQGSNVLYWYLRADFYVNMLIQDSSVHIATG
jgi:hypothetical protein